MTSPEVTAEDVQASTEPVLTLADELPEMEL
jgi:acyl CoA:acetate/3-ketoacid CoA transferase beta subunit